MLWFVLNLKMPDEEQNKRENESEQEYLWFEALNSAVKVLQQY